MGPVHPSVQSPSKNTVLMIVNKWLSYLSFCTKLDLLDTWIVSEILSSLPFLGADGGGRGADGQGRFIIIIIIIIIICIITY